ncbi:MAG: polysaccharide deacetylase family protein [Thermoleophilaceae bacterium]
MPSFVEERARAEAWSRFPGLENAAAGSGRCALTFDDGPDPEGTPAVLDALERAGLRATFFVLGEQLMRHHRLAREMVARGHELGLHGFAHERHETLSPASARDDVARGVGAFEAGVGRRPRWFRPPFGRFSEWSYAACADLGLEAVYWSAWGLDWETVPGARVAELVMRDLVDGSIVLLHDSARYAPREEVTATVEALGPISALAGQMGLRFVPLGELA